MKTSQVGAAPVAGGLLAGCLLLTGCAAGGPAPVAAVPAPPGQHQLSALPITHYERTTAQQAVLTRAEATLVHSCMLHRGLDYVLPTVGLASTGDNPSGDLPNSDPSLAAAQGYRDRTAVAAQLAAQRQPRTSAPLSPQITMALFGTNTPGHSATSDGCLEQARHTIAGASAADSDEVFGNAQLITDIRLNSYFAALSNKRVKDAFGAWSACMNARGFDYPNPVAAVDDPRWNALRPATTLEIRTATADVACKYQDNVDGVFHTAQVAQEDAAIAANLSALQEITAVLNHALTRAARIDTQASPTPPG